MSNVAILLRPGHPTGSYRRGGYVFHPTEPVVLPEADVTDEIRADGWLVLTEVEPEQPKRASRGETKVAE